MTRRVGALVLALAAGCTTESYNLGNTPASQPETTGAESGSESEESEATGSESSTEGASSTETSEAESDEPDPQTFACDDYLFGDCGACVLAQCAPQMSACEGLDAECCCRTECLYVGQYDSEFCSLICAADAELPEVAALGACIEGVCADAC